MACIGRTHSVYNLGSQLQDLIMSDRAPKPSGIFWELLSSQELAQIRVLRQLKQETEAKLGMTLPSGRMKSYLPSHLEATTRKVEAMPRKTIGKGGTTNLVEIDKRIKSKSKTIAIKPNLCTITMLRYLMQSQANVQTEKDYSRRYDSRFPF